MKNWGGWGNEVGKGGSGDTFSTPRHSRGHHRQDDTIVCHTVCDFWNKETGRRGEFRPVQFRAKVYDDAPVHPNNRTFHPSSVLLTYFIHEPLVDTEFRLFLLDSSPGVSCLFRLLL